MVCEQNQWLSEKEYLRQFRSKVAKQRIPLSGSIELTQRCNLRCVHCYLAENDTINRKNVKELTTRQWIDIIDEITEAGCLFLLITGGEPFLREDFGEIYRHAKNNGLVVTVFSNGTMITDCIIDLFHELPPQAVEISLYGATAPTYEKITAVRGAHAQCISGIEKLLEHRIRVKLKSVLMTLNRNEFYKIEDLAKKYDVDFRFDAAIFPRFNGDRAPVEMRIHPREAVEIEFSNQDRVQQWKDLLARMKSVHTTNSLYKCGAGQTAFHINAYGLLQPCVMASNFQYDLMAGDFSWGWRKFLSRIRDRKADSVSNCTQCDKSVLCGFCPAFFQLESGSEDVKVEYLCALGEYRLQAIEANCI